MTGREILDLKGEIQRKINISWNIFLTTQKKVGGKEINGCTRSRHALIGREGSTALSIPRRN